MAFFRRVEHGREVLLGLAHPLRDDLAEIDLVQLEIELARNEPRDHGLARSWLTGKQGRHTSTACDLASIAPLPEDLVRVANAPDQRRDLIGDVLGDDQIVPRLSDVDTLRQAAHPLGDVVAQSGRERRRIEGTAALEHAGRCERSLDRGRSDAIALCKIIEGAIERDALAFGDPPPQGRPDFGLGDVPANSHQRALRDLYPARSR